MTEYRISDDDFPGELIAAASAAWPDPSWEGWYAYDGPDEAGKMVCDVIKKIPPPCQLLLGIMATRRPEFLGQAAIPDLSLHGGGMHTMLPGSHLGLHLDASHHPRYGLERLASSVLFVGPWQNAWGGHLELWSDQASAVEITIMPQQGRLVSFAATNSSYHAVSRLKCPEEVVRKSLAIFWWGPPSGSVTRPRALFACKPSTGHGVQPQR